MWTLLTVIFVIISGTLSALSNPCDYFMSVNLAYIFYKPYADLVNENETFVDIYTGDTRACICLHKTCARKCCPPGYIYYYGQRRCKENPTEFNPPVYNELNVKEELKGFNATKEFAMMYGKMACSEQKQEIRVPVASEYNEMFLQRDGKLYVHFPKHIPQVTIYGPDKYCIDTFVMKVGNRKPHLNALVCFVSESDNDSYSVSSSCMLISCFFILLTVAVYAWLPELRNLHGMVLMAYLLCFFVGFLLLGTMQILIINKEITQDICMLLTFFIYFSLLAAFFWLNVMCYDIWWTFSGKRAHGRERSTMKRFLYYAIYAFGVPTVLTAILAALEFTEFPFQHALLPNLRLQGCFIHGNSKLLYFYGPIVILCVANMTFFALTALKIWQIKKETNKALRNKDSSTNDQNRTDTQRFTLYVKLFVVMGISWILEVVSSFYPDAHFFWQFSDAYNVLVGLIIFIIFVCKKKTFNLIKKRYRQLRGQPMSRIQTTSSKLARSLSQSRDEIQLNSIKK